MRSRRFSVRAAMWMVLLLALSMNFAWNYGTVFAPGVRRHLFDERLIGMTKDEILAMHGPPLKINPIPIDEGWERWSYSLEGGIAPMYYWRLDLCIDGKTQRVDSYFHQFYLD